MGIWSFTFGGKDGKGRMALWQHHGNWWKALHAGAEVFVQQDGWKKAEWIRMTIFWEAPRNPIVCQHMSTLSLWHTWIIPINCCWIPISCCWICWTTITWGVNRGKPWSFLHDLGHMGPGEACLRGSGSMVSSVRRGFGDHRGKEGGTSGGNGYPLVICLWKNLPWK